MKSKVGILNDLSDTKISKFMKSTTDRTHTKIQILGTLVALAWVVVTLDTFIFHHELIRFSIMPRNPIGLRGLLFAPFIHFNYSALLVDTIFFVILGWSVMKQAIANFTIVSIICSIVGDLGIWMLAPDSFNGSPIFYTGVGSLVLGYTSYLLALGYFDRRLRNGGLVALAICCIYVIACGKLPLLSEFGWSTLGFSWIQVICGCLGGILSAKLVFKNKHLFDFDRR
jgi:hypothetical protein